MFKTDFTLAEKRGLICFIYRFLKAWDRGCFVLRECYILHSIGCAKQSNIIAPHGRSFLPWFAILNFFITISSGKSLSFGQIISVSNGFCHGKLLLHRNIFHEYQNYSSLILRSCICLLYTSPSPRD